MTRLLLAVLLALAATPGKALDMEMLPRSVREEMRLAHMGCIDGRVLTVGPHGLRRLDLAGEGRHDYIIDDSDITCSGGHDFCGTGGCTLVIFMDRPRGYAKVLNELAISARFERRRKGYRLALQIKTPGGYPLTTTRLAFTHGCAVDLTRAGKRFCGGR